MITKDEPGTFAGNFNLSSCSVDNRLDRDRACDNPVSKDFEW